MDGQSPKGQWNEGTWVEPGTARRTVSFVDIGDEDDANELEDCRHRWLPGLSTETYADRVVCAGPMGVGVAYGRALIEDIERLARGDARDAGEASKRSCKRVGAWTRTTDLPENVARRWAAARVSPSRASETLATAKRYSIIDTARPDTATTQVLERLNEALSRYGFVEDPTGSGTWPLLVGGRATGREGATLARARARHGARAWGWMRASALGWVAIAGSAERDSETKPGACPECVRLHRQSSPWAEVLKGVGMSFEGAGVPGSELRRDPRSDIDGCAALIARGVARATGEASLQWWPCDESFPRTEERVPAHPRCATCDAGAHRGRGKRPSRADTWEALERVSRRTGLWTGLIPGFTHYTDDAIHDGRWGWTTTVTRGAQTRSGQPQSNRGGRRAVACGKGRSRGGAWASAVGEFVERECARWQDNALATVRASANALRAARRALHAPNDLVRFSETQMENRATLRSMGYRHLHIPAPFTEACEDEPIEWVEGVDMLSGERERAVLVPRSWVFIAAPADRMSGRTLSAATRG